MSEPQRNIPGVAFPPPEPHAVNGELRNPDVRHEATDVDTRAVLWFVAALAVGIVVVMVILWLLFRLFLGEETAKKRSTYPLAEEQRQAIGGEPLPPKPLLEGLGPVTRERNIGQMRTTDIQASHDVGRHRPSSARVANAEQEQDLAGYGWSDDKHTAGRIPIDEAMRRLADKLPARKADNPRPADEYLEQPSGPSSGRVPRGGKP